MSTAMTTTAVRQADNLGEVLERHSTKELATVVGGYRDAWKDLNTLVVDLDAVGFIGDGSAHPWAPMVLHKLHTHLQHPDHHALASLGHAGHTIHKLLAYLHSIMRRHVDLEREKRLWHAKSNVIQTMYWQNVASNTASTTATVRAPYSGVNYMVLDVLMDTVLTPPGMWTNVSFAGINFAQPGQTITYGVPGASGVQGGPQPGGMGFEAFLHDKTAPQSERGWNPWTGWILSSDAVSTWQWQNLDPANARTLFCSVLMRSSPCEMAMWTGNVQQTIGGQQFPIPWAGFPTFAHPGLGTHALDVMHAAMLGLSSVPKGHPRDWFSGQHMGHPGNYGSVGPGYGAHPSGHGGPFGPVMT
jgi:hypothetical protein